MFYLLTNYATINTSYIFFSQNLILEEFIGAKISKQIYMKHSQTI